MRYLYVFPVLAFIACALGDVEGGVLVSQETAGGASPGTGYTLGDREGSDLVSQTAAGGASPGTGFTLGDGEGGDLVSQTAAGGASPGDMDCQSEGVSRDMKLELLARETIQCITGNTTSLSEGVDIAKTIEEYRSVFKDYCAQISEHNKCATEVSALAERCMTEKQFKLFKILRDNLQMMLQVGCLQEGVGIATVIQAGWTQENVTDKRATLEACVINIDGHSRSGETEDPSKVSVHYYRSLISYKRCIVDFLQGTEVGLNAVETILNEILNQMKCIHPEQETEVLCKTIVNH